MIRFGLIGCGLHGERYLRHMVHDVQEAQPVALWRRDATAAADLADRYGVEACASRAELLARDDIDAVLITTPPGCHFEELRETMAAGLPTLVEKPVTATLDQADRLWSWLLDADRPPLMVAQTLRYNRVLLEAREHAVALGRLHRIRIQQRLEPTTIDWQRDPAQCGGGSVVLTGVHTFDLLRWFLGTTPDWVQARALKVEGYETVNMFDACFEYEGADLLCSTEVSKFSQTRSSVLELVGTEGQLVVDYQRGELIRIRGRDVEVVSEPGDHPTLPPTLRAFCRALAEGGPMPITFYDGRETLRMAEGCYRSSAEGRRLRLDDIAPRNHPLSTPGHDEPALDKES